jgi:hypothetical protein
MATGALTIMLWLPSHKPHETPSLHVIDQSLVTQPHLAAKQA